MMLRHSKVKPKKVGIYFLVDPCSLYLVSIPKRVLVKWMAPIGSWLSSFFNPLCSSFVFDLFKFTDVEIS